MFSKLFEQLTSISFELETLQKKIRKNRLSLEECKYELKEISKKMFEHHEMLFGYAKRFGFEIDYFMFVYLTEATEYVDTAAYFIKHRITSINSEILHDFIVSEVIIEFILSRWNGSLYDIVKKLVGSAICYWDDKYQEEFECWGMAMKESDVGLPLTRSAVVLQEREEEEFLHKKIIDFALRAEEMFFAVERNRNPRIPGIMRDLRYNRSTSRKTRVIDFNATSGRTIISSTIGGAKRDLAGVDQEALVDSAAISENMGWRVGGARNWNREVVKRGSLPYKKAPKPLTIKYQFQPLSTQLLNIYTSGVGRYGSQEKARGTPNILTVINYLTGKSRRKERVLAELFLRYKFGDSDALSYLSLSRNGLVLPRSMPQTRTLVGRINKVAYLVCFQEVYRRGIVPVNLPKLPFGVAIACSLRLIADGHLRMKDVFDTDAPYGVFSGASVMGSNLRRTTRKFYNLLSLFCKIYTEELYEVFEYEDSPFVNGGDEGFRVVFGPERYHQLLRESDGGREDSDGDEYEIYELPEEN